SDISYGDGKICKPEKPAGRDAPDRPVGSSLPGANIHFIWESRPDPPSAAIGGGLEETLWRLRTIDVSEGGEGVRVYQVNYLPELSGALGYKHNQSWITSIQVFGSDAQVDPPTGQVVSGTPAPPRSFEAPSQLYAPAASVLTSLAGGNQFVPPAQAQS